ncbi:pentatricopeptide repeat-containing protein At2g46050, mitochondrial [Aristolochia californica]|uniref:pentatricopeptide repeat-containing protein At2g46050, mitochondrial n=1 Tax=Aristolochia californica TaxID=171875 RepID=UPI0035E1D690
MESLSSSGSSLTRLDAHPPREHFQNLEGRCALAIGCITCSENLYRLSEPSYRLLQLCFFTPLLLLSMQPKSTSFPFVVSLFKRHLSIAALASSFVIKTAEDFNGRNTRSPKTMRFCSLIGYVSSPDISIFGSRSDSAFCSDALKFFTKREFLHQGREIHSWMIRTGLDRGQSLQNQLLNMYLKCGAFRHAFQLFNQMSNRNVVSWNIIISALLNNKHYAGPSVEELTGDFSREHLVVFFFKRMLAELVQPNYITFISVLGACVGLHTIEIGQQVHCCITKLGLASNNFVGSALLNLYAKFSYVTDARKVFDTVDSRDLVVWNVMMSCYNLNGLAREAFGVFELMTSQQVNGDDFTFSSLLNTCSIIGSYQLGMQMHGMIIQLSYDSDILVASALVDVYAKCGKIEVARKAFDEMNVRNTVSWTTMIVGYGKNGEGKNAVELFRQMLRESVKPDELTLASLLSSCANLDTINESMQLHAFVNKNGLAAFLSIGNALIHAYYKGGCLVTAFKCFSAISKPSLVTWTSMVCAYAFHGLAKEAIELFEEMLYEGIKPDRIAFVGVLSACSHAGLVVKGLHYFDSMRREYGIIPDSEHYTCLVDLLGRAGRLEDACRILTKMPFELNTNMLGAFIGACKVHANIKLAKWAAEMLFVIEPDEPVNYMLMSNMYASVGNWSGVSQVRKLMRTKCRNRVPGCSWIETCGKVHKFVCNDENHPEVLSIYGMLITLVRVLKDEEL